MSEEQKTTSNGKTNNKTSVSTPVPNTFPNKVYPEFATALSGQIIEGAGSYKLVSVHASEDASVKIGEFVALKTQSKDTIVGQTEFSATAVILGVAVNNQFVAGNDIVNFPAGVEVSVLQRGAIAVIMPVECKVGDKIGVDHTTHKIVVESATTNNNAIDTGFVVQRACKANEIAFLIK